MKSFRSKLKDHLPVAVVFLALCLLTVALYVAHERGQRDNVAGHAAADAREFRWGLQNGINAYFQLSRELAGFVAASPSLSANRFHGFLQNTSGFNGNPGIRYVGFVPRMARNAAGAAAGRGADGDPAYAYPYLYAFPHDKGSQAARGLDFSTVPERWEAMQQARDTGRSVVTRKHTYVTGAETNPIILLFTPVYDLALPSATVEQRRAALRGFVFSIYHVDTMVEQVMGREFRTHFDLEIFDGDTTPANLLYDGDRRPHALLNDPDFRLGVRERLNVGGREWQLYFFPTKAYFERYDSGVGAGIILAGLLLAAAAAALTAAWLRSHRARLLAQEQASRFAAVFEPHPSAVYLLDRDRRFLDANAQALREFGAPRDQLIGRPITDFIADDKQELARERFAQALSGASASYDSAILDAAGNRSELNVVLVPLRTDNQVSAVLALADNITAQRLREWELAESRRMLQRVINHIPQRVFWKDLTLRYLGCNNAFARDAGLDSPEQIIGKSDFELAWRASAESYRADDRQTLDTGQAKINYEERQERSDGSVSWLRTSKIPLTDIDGRTVALLGLYEDITVRKEMEAQLREMAHYDGLTGLSNRSFFHHQLEQCLAKAKRYDRRLALLYFDVDHFKQVNDNFGHEVGDALLTEFAQRVVASVRESDVSARLGGDEFAVLLDDLPDEAVAAGIAAKLLAAMRLPFVCRGQELRVSTSIGVAFYRRGMAGDDLIRRADQAMYRAKRNGRDRYEIDAAPIQAK